MRKWVNLCIVTAILVLSGCATQMEPPFDHQVYQKQPWKLRKVKLNDQVCWNIRGAVSVTNRGNTQMGTFTWKQVQDRFAINFYGPLNIGAFGIKGAPGSVTLVKPTGSYNAPNAETLMQEQMGWYLPVTNLYYWVRGLPAPGPSHERYDSYGHLAMLQQQGWTIQYQAYQAQNNADLPRKIIMDNEELHVKLVIKNWNLNVN